MPRAIALPLREQIVALHQQGIRLTQIATQLDLSYDTVRHCWQRFCREGSAALSDHYAQCGPQERAFPADLQAAALGSATDPY